MDSEAELLLRPLREVECGGPGTVDVERAVRHGRRVIRHRIAGSALGVVIAVAASAVMVPSLLHHESVPAAAPHEFSVLREEFSVAAAGGFTPVAYTTGRYRQVAELAAPHAMATVVFFPVGRPPEPGWRPVGERTDPVVDGTSAYYLDDTVLDNGHTELAWEWRPGGWAVVDLASSAGSRKQARQIAERVGSRYDGQVRVPFTIAAPSHGWHLLGVRTTFPREPAMPTVTLHLGAADVPTRVTPLMVEVGPKAAVEVGRGTDVGHGLVVATGGPAPDADKARVRAGVRLSVGPDPTDIAYWATNPIR
ncbi:hypothetical protein [Labedaea rhizosphaerae]|uniref:Uncharacterized protein n=1 Tax=Labedaea rhizosphaerae TaxID=598644 RepID=A0A4R6SCG3_LABRH|nr:hypothetical protein [Labedaea rhizosphaerae]TDP97237.1 hypothetical protein EV186_103200 [Labedaea rhizosphaerae]